MNATVKSSETVARGKLGGGPSGSNGNGRGGNGWRPNDESGGRKFSAAAYRITIWIGLATIVMMFAALSSAYIVLAGGEQWHRVAMPKVFFLSTAMILVSS